MHARSRSVIPALASVHEILIQVAQSDFDDVFKHEDSDDFCDVAHLWPRMDGLSHWETDRRIPRDVKLLCEKENPFDCRQMGGKISSKLNLLLHTNRTSSYHFDDGEPPLFNASQYVASTTFNEHQSVQADFNELQ